jgi:hypothetical protein
MKKKQNGIINRIIEKYSEINKDNPDKIDLLKPAQEVKDTFFEDFKKELVKSKELKKEE